MNKFYARLVRKKRFLRLYAKRSLKKALAQAFVGFVAGYTVGLQATQALNVAVLSGLISAAAYFMYEVLK
jgi:hypothetical protein